MRCDEIQERFIDLIYDETGTPAASPELRAHFDSCPACRSELDELKAVRRALGAWEDEAPLRSAARPVRVTSLAPAAGIRILHAARYGALAAMALLAFLALANAEITWNKDGFALRTRLLSRTPGVRDSYTKGEVRDLVRKALDDTESRLSEETLVVGQRLLDTIEAERRMELRFINARIGHSRVNN